MTRFSALIVRALACLTVVSAASGVLQAAEIQALRVWAGPDHTRVVFDVSGPLDYKIFSLENPHRLVLDISGSRLAEGFVTPEGSGVLGGVRTGKQGERDVRVVFDLSEGVRPKSFLLPPADKLGHRLVVDLHPNMARATPVVRTVQEAVPATEREARDGTRMSRRHLRRPPSPASSDPTTVPGDATASSAARARAGAARGS